MFLKSKASLATRLSAALLAGTILAGAVTAPVLADVPEAPSTVGAVYRAPSATVALKPGEKVDALFHRNATEAYVLQKLTDHTYWYQSGFYATIFYVGDTGVLLFDPLDGRADKILQAITSVTDKPITAIAYSHDHADHIGGTPDLLKLLEARGQAAPAIIATQATADKMERLGSTLPRPTQVVAWPEGAFDFEGQRIEVIGFDHAAHTDDHSAWLLTGERVLHSADLLNPDQPPFWNFAGSERFLYLQDNLAKANALDWDFFSGGHGNVGSHDDFAFHLKFIADLKDAVGTAMGEVPFGDGIDLTKINAHTVMLPGWYAEVARRATDSLRPAYGQVYGFETATPANAEMIAEYLASYR